MTAEQAQLSRAALTVFRLNGQFLGLAEQLARPVGLTAARWQVLGAVLTSPATVAGIARAMGITRQSVQRVADCLVAEGMAEYVTNPAHRRARLLSPTAAGRAAVGRIDPAHDVAARRLRETIGSDELTDALHALSSLSAALDAIAPELGQSEHEPVGDDRPGRDL